MPVELTPDSSRCLKCGFEAPQGSSDWTTVDAPPLGSMTQCPECGSTNVLSPR